MKKSSIGLLFLMVFGLVGVFTSSGVDQSILLSATLGIGAIYMVNLDL